MIRFGLQILTAVGTSYNSQKLSQDLESLLKGSEIYFLGMLQDYSDESLSRLLQPEDGSLPMNITVTILNFDPKPAVQFSNTLSTFTENSLRTMTQNLKTLYLHSDSWRDAPTKVVCEDGTEFKVNRGILCVRSPVFRNMFQTEMSEADSGQVKIEDIPSKALDVFLHFVHTGELKDNWKEMGILEGLTYAAHKYELKGLFEFLEQSLGHLVNLDNCGRLMCLAKTLGMKQAEEKLMDYFKREVTSIEQAARIMIEASSVLDLYPKDPETGNE